MNPEIKARWVERLRSGKIRQGKRRLGSTNGYRCCLGVLCDIAVEDGVIGEPEAVDVYLKYAGEEAQLPSAVHAWAGLNLLAGEEEDLIQLNDVEQWSFTHIADYIEENL